MEAREAVALKIFFLMLKRLENTVSPTAWLLLHVAQQRERAGKLAECSLTANEGENVFPVRASLYRTH